MFPEPHAQETLILQGSGMPRNTKTTPGLFNPIHVPTNCKWVSIQEGNLLNVDWFLLSAGKQLQDQLFSSF